MRSIVVAKDSEDLCVVDWNSCTETELLQSRYTAYTCRENETDKLDKSYFHSTYVCT